MRMLVVSDAHRNAEHARALVGAAGEVDAVCFLGDCDADAALLKLLFAQAYPGAAFYAVAGNNNPESPLPEEITFEREGLRILMTHGHRQVVRMTPLLLEARAREACADLVLFGHTHVPKTWRKHGALFVNPGPLGDTPRAYAGSYALVTVTNGEAEVSLCKLPTP